MFTKIQTADIKDFQSFLWDFHELDPKNHNLAFKLRRKPIRTPNGYFAGQLSAFRMLGAYRIEISLTNEHGESLSDFHIRFLYAHEFMHFKQYETGQFTTKDGVEYCMGLNVDKAVEQAFKDDAYGDLPWEKQANEAAEYAELAWDWYQNTEMLITYDTMIKHNPDFTPIHLCDNPELTGIDWEE